MGRAHDDDITDGRIFSEDLISEDRTLNLLRTDTVPRDVDNIIGATMQGKGTIVGTPCIIALGVAQLAGPTTEIDLGKPLNITAPIGLPQTIAIAPECSRKIGVG